MFQPRINLLLASDPVIRVPVEWQTCQALRVEKLESRCKFHSNREGTLNHVPYSSYRFTNSKLSVRKILGFLGLASEVLDFELEAPFLFCGFIFALFAQFAAKSGEDESPGERRVSFGGVSRKRS